MKQIKITARFIEQLCIADGYIELGMFLEANEALEDIEPALRATVEMLERREKNYAGLDKPDLLDVVRRKLYPSKP